MSWISFTSVVEARLSHWYVEGLRGYIRRGLLKASPHFAKMVNKTFVCNVNILRNVTHQHVHLHGVNMDHLTIIIIGYVLLGVSLLLIRALVAYRVKERWRLLARLCNRTENLSLYS